MACFICILGAFGKVYKVCHKKSRLIYAIKEMSKAQLKANNMVEQVANEVKIMYSLNNENIIKLYNHFEDDKNIYLVIEFASGVLFLNFVVFYLFFVFRDNFIKICSSNLGSDLMRKLWPKLIFDDFFSEK